MKKKYAKDQLQEANYVRERLELYLKLWVLPKLDEVLNELSK